MIRISQVTVVTFLFALSTLPASAAIEWTAPVSIETSPVGSSTTGTLTPSAPRSASAAGERRPFFNLFKVQYRHSFYYPEIFGNISRRSKDERLYDEKNISLRMMRSWNDYVFSANTSARYSDDPQVAGRFNHKPELLSLVTSLAYKDRWDLNFGNVLPNYHRYAISSSMDGLTFNYRQALGERGHKLDASTAFGRTARGIDNQRFTRYLSGANLGWTSPARWWGILEQGSLRVAASQTQDDVNSIGQRGTLAEVEARALAVRNELKFAGGWNFDADWGIANGQSNVLAASRPLKGHAFSSNLAYRRPYADARYTGVRRLLPTSGRASYEIVGEDYYAPQAAVGADQFRWGLNAEHPFYEWLGYSWNFNRFEDNARERRALTNYSINQGHGLSITPFKSPLLERWFDLAVPAAGGLQQAPLAGKTPNAFVGFVRKLEPENFRLNLNFRHSGRFSTNRTTNSRTEDYSAGASHRIGRWSFGGQYAWQLIDDNINAGNDRRSSNWSVNLGRSFDLKRFGLTFQTNAGYRRGYDALRTGAQSTRNENINAGFSTAWKGISAGADWSFSRTARNIGGSGSRTHNVRVNLGGRTSYLPALDVRVSGSLMDVNEENRPNSYRTRDVRLDMTYDF